MTYDLPLVDPHALRAIRAWLRLDQAFKSFNRELERRQGITGAQLAMLRIVAERQPTTLAQLRAELRIHPATFGQLIDRITRAGFLTRTLDPADQRRRSLGVTAKGHRVLNNAPLAGPIRLRQVHMESARLELLADAFDDAIVLFGMERWAT